MPFDYVVKQGDSAPALTDTLTYSDGSAVNLTGATLKLVARAASAATSLTLTGASTVTAPLTGNVRYSPTSADTSTPGVYQASWVVTFADASVMTFPTVGYLSWSIEPNVTAAVQQLISLGEVKDHLFFGAQQDRRYDAQLLRMIRAIRAPIEAIVGPVALQTFDEKYDGGNNVIVLRHRPSAGYGTSPVINLLGVSEYRGPIEYPLTIVPSPVAGSIYSVELDIGLGSITRRSAGGGTVAFMPGRNSVHVVYQAGQTTVPENVRDAALEWIRVNWETTQSVGRGGMTVADEQNTGVMPKMGMPQYVRQMLAPTRRAPSIA